MSWDIFCNVVDNYGDIGVCWRLSRQLAAERGESVRLWVDDVAPLARIWPGVDPHAEAQHVAGVDIVRWTEAAAAGATPGEVVIEAFGCETPPGFVEAMTRRLPQPAWFNLEYLSAEDWVETHHLLPSPHPRLPLVKYFYFPGFTARTGGLLREANLFALRDAFQRDPAEVAAMWRGLGIDSPSADELRISLFSYANPAAPVLFDTWARGGRPVTCIVSDGVLAGEIAGFLGARLRAGETRTRGNLRLACIPFVSQTGYDRLLWACDFNFVRGEDSFVRAQWAARPLAWHIYPQEGDAHRPKLAAFVARYGAALDSQIRWSVGALFDAWNGAGDIALAWRAVEPNLERWRAGAATWAGELGSHTDLATALAENALNRL